MQLGRWRSGMERRVIRKENGVIVGVEGLGITTG